MNGCSDTSERPDWNSACACGFHVLMWSGVLKCGEKAAPYLSMSKPLPCFWKI